MTTFTVGFLPLDQPLVDKKGILTSTGVDYFRSVHNVVSTNFNDFGVHFPTIEPGSLALTPTNTLENGATYYNTTDNQPETIIEGVRHSFNTTPTAIEGYVIPTVSDVNTLSNQPEGSLVFDKATNKLRVLAQGIWENLH